MSAKLNLKFVNETLSRTIANKETGESKTTYREVIKITNLDNGISRIHPYTDFINKWRNVSIKRAHDVACHFIKFINHLYFELSEEELPSIEDLTFHHAAYYLQEYSKSGVQRATVMIRDNVIKDFYFYLAKKEILNYISLSDFTYVEKSGNIYLESPFRDKYTLPDYSRTERLHHIDFELIFEFIRTAMETTPRIALAVYFQMFGGLRVSEALNLTYTAIHMKAPNGRSGAVLDLRKRRLRPDLKVDAFTSPKKIRNQPVLPVGNLLGILYYNHQTKYQKLGCSALFINNNGLPMSRDSYYYYFEKLKRAFITKLRAQKNPLFKLYADFLNSKNWSSHICRGVFSEIVADSAKTPIEIAIWRGDSDIKSCLSYLSDSRRLGEKVTANLNDFYNKMLTSRL
jgi:integrase